MTSNNHRLINFFIILSTFLIILNFFFFVIEKSPVQYSDWLINYQGGFVRRGLPGEIFYQIHNITKIRLDIIVFIAVSAMYIFFSSKFIELIKKIKLNFLNLLILFSPLSFFYPVMEQKISGRKDIIFIFSAIFLAAYLNKIKFNNQKYLIILLILISTFSHSGFFVYIPVFFFIFLVSNYNISLRKIFIESIIISFFTILFFIMIIFNTSIDNNSILKICDSIKIFLPNCGQSDYIETLNWTLKYEKELVAKIWNKENYKFFYTLAFVIANAPLMYGFYKSELNKKFSYKFKPIIIFFLINLITFPIYFIGADYGRYMYLSYLSLLIIYFKAISTKFIIIREELINIKKPIIILIIFLFGFTWTIPHCCSNNFKFIFQKPIMKIINLN